MPVVHAFDPPDRFVVGTVGEPGARTFFLQARAESRIVSVALEKGQVAALAERLDELLDEVMQATSTLVPAVAPFELDDSDPLDQPITEEFRVGTMTLSWEPTDERVVIEVFPIPLAGPEEAEPAAGDEDLTEALAEALSDELEDLTEAEPEPEEVLLVRLTPAYARAFVKRAELVIEAGRPSCLFCGNPVDPEGHLCVRANGFKRRDPV